MRHVGTTIVLCCLLASCQFVLGIEEPIDGSDDRVQSGDPACAPVELISAKVYEPSDFCADSRNYGDDVIEFLLPDEIVTTDGRPGNHCAELEMFYEGERVVCVYKGDFDDVYEFNACRAGAPVGFPICGQDAAGRLINRRSGDLVIANSVTLSVKNGRSSDGRTEARVTLSGSCDPDDVDSICIDFRSE